MWIEIRHVDSVLLASLQLELSPKPHDASLLIIFSFKALTNFYFHHKFLLSSTFCFFPVAPFSSVFAPTPISRRAKTRPVSQWLWGFCKGILLPQVPTKVLQWWRISFKAAFKLPFAEFWQLKTQETPTKYLRFWVGRTKSGRSFPTIGPASP